MTFKQKDEIIDILENLPYWDTCPQDYKDRIPELVKALNQVNNGVLDDVSELLAPKEVKSCMKADLKCGEVCKEHCGASWC